MRPTTSATKSRKLAKSSSSSATYPPLAETGLAAGPRIFLSWKANADPALANFREYRAALERNDLSAAETAAAAALAASEAPTGVDPRLTALTLGRAEVAAKERAGDRRLVAAIAAAETDPRARGRRLHGGCRARPVGARCAGVRDRRERLGHGSETRRRDRRSDVCARSRIDRPGRRHLSPQCQPA